MDQVRLGDRDNEQVAVLVVPSSTVLHEAVPVACCQPA